MSWGYGITFLYLGFVAFIITLVITTFQHDVNLVAKDYYKKEIAYQEEIDKQKNTLEAPEKIQFTKQEGKLGIIFPEETKKGEIHFFRPSDYKKDFKMHINLDAQSQQWIATNALEKGLWRVKIDWTSEGKNYFVEERIIVKDAGIVTLVTEDKEVVINVNGVVRLTKDETKKSRSERKLN